MNEKNLDYLQKQLFTLGFKDKLNSVLEQAISKELPEFTIGLNNRRKGETGGFDHLRYELNFSRSKKSDLYFLNDYEVGLRKEGDPWPRVQLFDLEQHHRVTALEAYNLLSGRSIYKEIFREKKEDKQNLETERPDKTSIWMKLNMDVTEAYGYHPVQRFYPEYGYMLEESLSKYPFISLEDAEKKEGVLKDLKKGKLAEMRLDVNGELVPVFVAANPEMKTIDIYDKQMTELRSEDIFPANEKDENQQSQSKNASVLQNDQGLPSQLSVKPWEQDEHSEKNIVSRGR